MNARASSARAFMPAPWFPLRFYVNFPVTLVALCG